MQALEKLASIIRCKH